MKRLALIALVALAAALAPVAAATTRPSVGRLWHAFPLGHTRLAHTPERTPPSQRRRPRPAPRPQPPRPASPARARTHQHGTGTLSAALAGSATALTVIALIGVGRRRGWTGRPPDTDSIRARRAGTAPRVLAFYAVAAAIGVIVGLLIPLIA